MSELVAEPGAAEAAPTPDPTPAPEPLADGAAAGEVTDAAAPAVAEAAPFNPTEFQAELEFVRQQNEAMYAELQRLNRGGEQQLAGQVAPTAGFDPASFYDEFGNLDAVALLNAQRTLMREEVGTLRDEWRQQQAAVQEQEQQQRGYENVLDMIGDDVARNGEFASDPQADTLARQRVYARAEELLQTELIGKLGATSRTAEIAIQRAAAEEREYLRAVRGEAAAQQAHRLTTLAGAPGEPGAGAAGGVQGRPVFKDPREVVEHYAAQARNL